MAEPVEPGKSLTAETIRQTQNEIRDRKAFELVLAKVPNVESELWDHWASPSDGSTTKS